MTGEGAALLAAVCFGVTDVLAGLLARRASGAVVALYGQLAGTAVVLLLASRVAAPGVGPEALAWGALSGVGTGLGAAALFLAMGVGRFSVVVPLSVVAGVALPVLVDVLLLGNSPGPLAWTGMAAAVPALWLVTRTRDGAAGAANGAVATGAPLALVSGAAFAVQYGALAQADPAAGLWPVAANRVASVLAILPLVARRPARARVSVGTAAAAAATGAVSLAAITAFTLAGRAEPLSVVVVLTSMYPVVPVVVGFAVLGERPTRGQAAGLICAATSVALITLS
ncbi:EamA family transporter [Marinitenerispora sediminis]|uniref:Multidrug DMT transporter permease n=1 Tax=Marinitenerispora sediminis TaxID=1931232 RepID=A0A368T2S7_9ACTN|nr:EamA family transporter [Marinitenerispora sediminis]RCV49161.1 multidrug DMT transporter permease [Marinitenerispora sediminis]RCV55944.1 multidrug DMT transporter permease [Marinitenerispora sediminis]RCV60398.1 multidrug DMT transporter permease [Marinitenerispora sediminis]